MTRADESENAPKVEPTGFSTRPVVIFGLGVIASLVVVYAISAWIVAAAGEPSEEVRSEATPWELDDPEEIPEAIEDWPPHLRPDPEVEYELLRDRQLERLESYGWVDREREIIHIPIDDAIDLVLRDEPIARDIGREGGE